MVSWYQKGRTSLDLNEARDKGVLGCIGISWTTCKQSAPRSRQIIAPTPHHSICTGPMLMTPNQQCQGTEGIRWGEWSNSRGEFHHDHRRQLTRLIHSLTTPQCGARCCQLKKLSTKCKLNAQEAQLSPRDRAMRRVSWNLANCHATVQNYLYDKSWT